MPVITVTTSTQEGPSLHPNSPPFHLMVLAPIPLDRPEFSLLPYTCDNLSVLLFYLPLLDRTVLCYNPFYMFYYVSVLTMLKFITVQPLL